MPHPSRNLLYGALVASVAIVAILTAIWRHQANTPDGGQVHDSGHRTAQEKPLPGGATPVSSPVDSAKGRLLAAITELERGTPEKNAAYLEQLARFLESMPPAEAIAAIRAFLASGRDAKTGLDYSVGSGGILASAPSLRVFLLDELGQLAKTGNDPASSLAVSREVLATPTSPDEWSLALRNVAWADKNSGDYLNQKFQQMLAQPTWTANPSTGLLESFDIPVFTQNVAIIPQMDKALQEQDNPASRAAAVALDRLAEASPLKVMNYLNGNPGVLADSPMLRADYFSKADLSNPEQVGALETYFSRTDVSPAEIAKVVDGLASPGSFVSNNLLTTSTPPDPDAKLKSLEKTGPTWAGRFPTAYNQFLLIQQRNQPQ